MFSTRDFPPGIIQYFVMPCLSMTGFHSITKTSVVAAVDRLYAAVTQAIDLAVLSGHIKKHKYLTCFLKSLLKIIFIDVTRS
jgi:hypothetical protein